jgi:hypothetical protein
MTKKTQILYLDADENPCPKERAVKVRILTVDQNCKRLEVYGVIDREELAPEGGSDNCYN